MKKYFSFFLILILAIVVYIEKDPIVNYITSIILKQEEIVIPNNNAYALNNNFQFVQITNNFTPSSKQDLINIVYTFLDHGWDNFYFYCEDNYPTCINDVKEIARDSTLLSDINNFVHPYNSYNKLYITVNNFGKVTLAKDWLYNEEEINNLNQKVDEILTEIKVNNQDFVSQIKAIHDYIIDHSIYDSERAELIKSGKTDDIKYPSHKAIGPLIKGQALCSGYSDAMAIFLERLQIKNYKIASSNHVWNAIYLDNKWYHLDLTWDDPVVSTHENIRLDEFFMIDTTTLKQKDSTQHTFEESIYSEVIN